MRLALSQIIEIKKNVCMTNEMFVYSNSLVQKRK